MENIIDNFCLICKKYLNHDKNSQTNNRKEYFVEIEIKPIKHVTNSHMIKFICENCFSSVKKFKHHKNCEFLGCENTINYKHFDFKDSPCFCDEHIKKCKIFRCNKVLLGNEIYCNIHNAKI